MMGDAADWERGLNPRPVGAPAVLPLALVTDKDAEVSVSRSYRYSLNVLSVRGCLHQPRRRAT